MQHLLFFDSQCAFCQRSIRFIMKIDSKKIIGFAPLDGETASKYLDAKILSKNSLVFLENYKTKTSRVWVRGRGVCRILWLIGGLWSLLGWAWCIPYGVDGIYKFIAMHRRDLGLERPNFSKTEKKRFLP